MALRPFSLLALVASAAILVAGCGSGSDSSGGSGSVPAGASIAPANVSLFISLASDPNGDQWKAAEALLDRFPGKDDLVADLRAMVEDEGLNFEDDLKPALGPELDLVLLDYENGGENLVGLTQPADKAKFIESLEAGDEPAVSRDFEGWLIFASEEEQLDRFEAATRAGRLADQDEFSDLITHAPDDALAKLFLAGEPLAEQLVEEASGERLPDLELDDVLELRGLVGWARAEQDGVRFELDATAETPLPTGSFEGSLAGDFPAGAVAFANLSGLDKTVRTGVDSALKTDPQTREQLQLAQTVLGLSLEGDVYPLLEGELGAAIYPADSAEGQERVLAAVAVDEDEAERLVSRLDAVLALSGESPMKVTVAGTQFLEIPYEGESVLVGVADEKLIVSTSRSLVEQLLGDGAKLSEDPAYTAARSAADVPAESSGFLYVNLVTGLPYLLEGSATSREEENLEPLRSAVLYWGKDGDVLKATGFVEIR